MLVQAIITITVALALYTIAVFWERKDGRLNKKHMVFFILGLLCDITGTLLMERVAGSWDVGIHAITGIIAIVIMLLHTAFAAVALINKNERLLENFHKLSLHVWLVWLIPYFLGMLLNMKF